MQPMPCLITLSEYELFGKGNVFMKRPRSLKRVTALY